MSSRNESLDPTSDAGPAPTTGRRHLLGAGLGLAGGAAAAVGLAGAPAHAAAIDATFWPYGPVRVADTRSGLRITKGMIAGGRSRTVTLGDYFLTGYTVSPILNLAVLATAGRGSLTIWENGVTRPNVFSLNWSGAGQSTSNLALTGLRPSDLSFNIYCGGSSKAKAHVVIDMFGYFFREETARPRPPVERRQPPG